MTPEVTIKKAIDETPRLTVQVGEGSKRYFMLMERDYLTLKFSTAQPVELLLGDFVEIENAGRYELTDTARGEFNKTTGGYDYEIRLNAQYWKFKNKLFKFLPQVGSNETSWSYTDTLPNHAQQVLFNLRALAYRRDDDGNETLNTDCKSFLYNGKTDWRIEWDESVDKTKAVTIQYDSKNIIDAISEIAEAYECEWWFEENVLHFGKCQYGTTPIKLELGKELVSISRSDSKESYATRIYAYGSKRNLASNYRKQLVFDATVTEGKLYDPNREIQLEWFKETGITKTVNTNDSNSCRYNEIKTRFEASASYNQETNTSFTRVFVDSSYRRFNGALDYDGTLYALSLAGLTIKFTQHIGSVSGKVRARLILQASLDRSDFNDPYDYFDFEVEEPVQELGKEVTLKFSDKKIKTRGVPIDFKLQLELGIDDREPTGTKREVSAKINGTPEISYYPEWKATGITIEVLDKKTGDVDHTIEGAIFNADFETLQRKITIPVGAAISTGDKYRLPQLNNAIVPARYFTSKYTAFTKYQDITTNGIVNSRLLLPEFDEQGNPMKGYIDAFEFESEEQAVEDVVIFEDVYPSRISKIKNVSESDEYTTEQPEQDGSKTLKTYREYIYEDDLFGATNTFNRGDYLIDGTTLKVTFQSGLLNGMTFEVQLLEDNYHFQIKRDNTTLLPNEIIKPQVGDEFILHGFNIAMLSDSDTDYISSAEQELLRKARKYVAELNTDTSTYQCTVACDLAYELDKDSPDGLYLGIGRRVNLIHPGYFKEGRISRVMGYEMPLDIPYDNPVYYIGDKAKYSRLGAIEDKLDSMGNATSNMATTGTGAGNSPYVIQQIDATPPTDKNVYSALRSRIEFALKTATQNIRYLWSFLKGARFGTYIEGQSGAQIDGAGNAEFESLQVRTYLKVRELIYNRLNAQEGEVSFSDSGTIESVTDNADGSQTAVMRRRWEGDFTAFQPGDVVYGYVNDLGNSSAKEYGKAWAWVESVDQEANTLKLRPYPDTETPSGHNMAMTGSMMIARWGNRIVPSEQTASEYYFIKKTAQGAWYNTRQRSVMISCEGGNICELTGVDAPILRPSNFGTVLGVLPEGLIDEETAKYMNLSQPYLYARGIVVQDLIRIGYNGEEIKTPRFRGEWDATIAADGTEYYRDADSVTDIVTYGGCLWQCLVEHATAEAPADGSSEWMKLTSRDYSDYRIIPSVNVVYIREGSHSTDLIKCTVRHFNADGYTDYTTPEALDTLGVKLLFSLDGTTYNEFWVRDGAVIESGDGETLELSAGDSLEIGGNNVPWVEIGDNIHFYVRRNEDNKILDAYTVPVVRDGEKGEAGSHTEYRYRTYSDALANIPMISGYEKQRLPSGWTDTIPTVEAGRALWMICATIDGDNALVGTWSYPVRLSGQKGAKGDKGDPGIPGIPGLMAYPAGIYDDHTVYTSTETTTPVVMDGRDAEGVAQYFVLKAGQTYCGLTATYATPHEDAAYGGTAAQWVRMDRFNSIFADIVMAEFGKLASAVFSGDLMFSEQGVDGDGEPSTDYRLIKTGGFTPNLKLDLKTGEAYIKSITAGNTRFSGEVMYGNSTPFGKGLIKGEITAPNGRRESNAPNRQEHQIAEIVVDAPASVKIALNLGAHSSNGFIAPDNKGITASIEIRLYAADNSYQTLHTLEANTPRQDRTYSYSDTLSLAAGTYRLALVIDFEQSASTWWEAVPPMQNRTSAEVTWDGAAISADGSGYISLRYGNGWVIGDSPSNYAMAYEDEEQNMVFQVQTKTGYGLKLCPGGLMVMPEKYSGWMTLENYIKKIAQQ